MASAFLPAPFIVGQHRSGTTLLRLMLDAHPELAIPPETQFIPLVAERCAGAADPGAGFVAMLLEHTHWDDFHLDGELLRERLSYVHPFELGAALRVFYSLYAERFGKSRWGDKTPRYVRHMELIQRLLPEARFVHLIRDGRDVGLSVLDERLVAGKSRGSLEHVAERWVEKIRYARRQAAELRYYVEIRYEDLVLDTEYTLRRICDFVDLRWDVGMLEYHRSSPVRLAELVTVDEKWSTAAQRRSRHALTARPPEPSRVGRWKTEMAEPDLIAFEHVAGELLAQLGYEIGARSAP
jgi:hypothetical protein